MPRKLFRPSSPIVSLREQFFHWCSFVVFLKEFSALHEEVLDDWTERHRRNEIQCADQEHGAAEQNEECPAVNGKRASADRRNLLSNQRTSERQDRNNH